MKKLMSGLLLLLYFWCWPLPSSAVDMMLPQLYEEKIDVSGWLVSEKFDGVRGYWNGTVLLSKNGIPFQPPPEFLMNLPDFALEGEIWGGRGSFEKTAATVKKQTPDKDWLKLKFAIFDVPEKSGGFRQRLAAAQEWFSNHPSDYAFVISQKILKDKNQLQKELNRVEKLGGEGLIVRKADGLYNRGRSAEILKVKSFYDTEAVVVEHIAGKGRNKGRLGSLLVELPDGLRFKIGTGFSDEERINPPPLGTLITFKYYGFYQSGIPKFPSFLRIRQDSGL